MQFIEVQLDPASTDLPNNEFLQLRVLQKNALQQEREARRAESELSERIKVATSALLPLAEGLCGITLMDLEVPGGQKARAARRDGHARRGTSCAQAKAVEQGGRHAVVYWRILPAQVRGTLSPA